MRTTVAARFAASLGLALLAGQAAAQAQGLDCSASSLRPAQVVICQDAQLMRSDEQTARRIRGLARRLGFGAYLGLRYWHSNWKEQRVNCAADRACITVTYRAQSRFLDRLQRCVDGGQRRTCLRSTLSGEREAVRR